MTSSLQAQLASIHGHTKSRPRSNPSLIFDQDQAASLDLDSVFAIASNGFQSLINLSPTISSFGSTVLSHRSITYNRDLSVRIRCVILDFG